MSSFLSTIVLFFQTMYFDHILSPPAPPRSSPFQPTLNQDANLMVNGCSNECQQLYQYCTADPKPGSWPTRMNSTEFLWAFVSFCFVGPFCLCLLALYIFRFLSLFFLFERKRRHCGLGRWGGSKRSWGRGNIKLYCMKSFLKNFKL